MDNKGLISVFKAAEKHWSRPEWLCRIIGYNHTEDGLCHYFFYQFKSTWERYSLVLLWINYRTNYSKSDYHFHNRKERLQAIRNIIKDLENDEGGRYI